MTDDEILLALRALTPRLTSSESDLAPAILARLRDRPRQRVRAALVITFALLVLAAGAAAASDAGRRWLREHGVTLLERDALPPTRAVHDLAGLGFGRVVTAGAAARALGAALPTVPKLGRPDAYLVSVVASDTVVSEVWGSGARRVLLTIGPLRQANDPAWLGKVIAPPAVVDWPELSDGRSAIWIGGAPSAVALSDGSVERFRLSANALLWSEDGRLYRLESSLSESAALTIARAL